VVEGEAWQRASVTDTLATLASALPLHRYRHARHSIYMQSLNFLA
jgi:hypothetical protein